MGSLFKNKNKGIADTEELTRGFDFGGPAATEEAKRKLKEAQDKELMKGLPPLPKPPPDLTDEMLVRRALHERSATTTRRGLSSTFKTGQAAGAPPPVMPKPKVGG
jgi:hypothetical protein